MDNGYHLRKRQQARRDQSAFATLFAEADSNNQSVGLNTDLDGVFVLPANATIMVKTSVLITAGQFMVLSGSRTISLPALAAEKFHTVGYFQKGSSIGCRASLAGDISFYMRSGLGTPLYLGKATVS